MKLFRWKAIVPVAVFVLLVALGWSRYADRLIRLAVQAAGADVVGARVDLTSARLHLFRGGLVLRGLAVTNPDAPLSNLFEVDEIKVDLDVRALLEKKFVAETAAVRGLRFGTARRTSGALPGRKPTPGLLLYRSLAGWAHGVAIPSLDLGGLGRSLDVGAVNADSLRTLALARAVTVRGDSLKGAWERQLGAADTRAVIDSAQALAGRLAGADIRRLGLAGARDAAASLRSTVTAVTASRNRLASLQRDVAAEVASLQGEVAALDQARAEDYAYARRRVKIPSLDPKDVSAALFGRAALERMQPPLFWAQASEHHMPAGLAPQRHQGPTRVRMAGTTVVFPQAHRYPSLLIEFAEGTFALGGSSVATGSYVARVTGYTTEPAVYGRPLTFLAERSGAVAGPERIRVGGVLDHTGRISRDSLTADLDGVRLPAFDLDAVGARMDLNRGSVNISLSTVGDSLMGRWLVRSDSVVWAPLRDTGASDAAAPRTIGSRAWANALLWRVVSSLRSVQIEARISGRLAAPRLDVSSNVGGEVSRALRLAVAEEANRAEAQVRSQVDSLVGAQVSAARARLAFLNTGVLGRLTEDQSRLGAAQAQLEQRLKGLVPGLPGLR